MKRTLIVVDMQKDFIDGALGTREAQLILPNVKKKIAEYQAGGGEIIFTRDTHQSGCLETNEGRHLPVVHCIEGTEGWKIWEGLEVPGALYVDKPTFGYIDWAKYQLEDVELIGVCTDICVVSNALILKAIYPEIRIKVDADCCAGVTPESHRAALQTMKMCQIKVLEGEQVNAKK